MTDPTNHPQGAEEFYLSHKSSDDKLPFQKKIAECMNDYTGDWLKYFVERVKVQPFTLTHDDLDSLLSEVTTKMKEGKP